MRNGVIKVIRPKDRSWYTPQEVQELMGVGRSKAYEIIKTLRKELTDSGIMAPVYPPGRIPKDYFNKRMCIGDIDIKEVKRA